MSYKYVRVCVLYFVYVIFFHRFIVFFFLVGRDGESRNLAGKILLQGKNNKVLEKL